MLRCISARHARTIFSGIPAPEALHLLGSHHVTAPISAKVFVRIASAVRPVLRSSTGALMSCEQNAEHPGCTHSVVVAPTSPQLCGAPGTLMHQHPTNNEATNQNVDVLEFYAGCQHAETVCVLALSWTGHTVYRQHRIGSEAKS